MKNIILGDGIAGYAIAACLAHEGIKFTIFGNGQFKAPDILLLKLKDVQYWQVDEVYTNEHQIEFYFEAFGIEATEQNKKKYLKHIKIGYRGWDGTIKSTPTQKDIESYLTNQGREITKSAMSDGETSFIAIDLLKVYEHLKERFKDNFKQVNIDTKFINQLNKKDNTTIWNTIIPTKANDNQPSFEYLVESKTIMDFDYIYDCARFSGIKRITPTHIECYEKPNNPHIVIKNYYQSPTIYTSEDMKRNFIWYDISRNATKTQLKVEDIIRYIVYHCFDLEN